MTIQYAILGLLSWKPLSGYDLKKIISDSVTFYWSGNNNQIYRTLIQLHTDELVIAQVQQQESLPAKKIYSITAKGRSVLRDWVRSTPILPELRNTFLIQLAWADVLSDAELDELLETYEAEIAMQVQMQQESARRGQFAPARTAREQFLWEKISENVLRTFQNELSWVHHLRNELRQKRNQNELPVDHNENASIS